MEVIQFKEINNLQANLYTYTFNSTNQRRKDIYIIRRRKDAVSDWFVDKKSIYTILY